VNPRGSYDIALRGVSTRWPRGEPIHLDDFDLRAGRRLAILGGNGAGTLAAVLLRILDYRGSITLNGMELRALAGDDLRRIIGHCCQDAHVFNTTIAENVRMARPASSDAEVTVALRRAGVGGRHPLPDGLATRIGRPGTVVSGCDRLRLSLARALLAGLPVLVIEEPPADLARSAADALLTDLLTAAAGRTVLLVTHRVMLPGADPVLRHVDEVICPAQRADPLQPTG
jgi:ABC-type transport system involved in cytochrome bd biosynthesis fused ATPase/permease subunit